MKLSIVVPVYKTEATLNRCVESIIGQTFTDYELILVDDGSPDACPQRCDEWALRDSRIRVIHQENGGLSAARNAGIDIAQGEYITFVDSDDFLKTDTYAKVMPEAADCDIVEFPVLWHYGSPSQQRLSFGNQKYTDMRTYWLEGRAYAHTYAWNKIYRRELFREVRYPVGRVFEDVATLPALLERTKVVKTCHEGLYYYCMNAKGITQTAKGPQLEMLLDSHLPVISRWCNDAYYMHVLNIQMDVCELTKQPPRLPFRRINPWSNNLSNNSRLKALVLNIIGIKGICRLNKIIHKIHRSHS